jgi:hypothetical protein
MWGWSTFHGIDGCNGWVLKITGSRKVAIAIVERVVPGGVPKNPYS